MPDTSPPPPRIAGRRLLWWGFALLGVMVLVLVVVGLAWHKVHKRQQMMAELQAIHPELVISAELPDRKASFSSVIETRQVTYFVTIGQSDWEQLLREEMWVRCWSSQTDRIIEILNRYQDVSVLFVEGLSDAELNAIHPNVGIRVLVIWHGSSLTKEGLAEFCRNHAPERVLFSPWGGSERLQAEVMPSLPAQFPAVEFVEYAPD